MKKIITIAAFFLAIAVTPAQAEITASAIIRPGEITLGEAAQLEVTIKGATSAERPIVPKVEGLNIQLVGSQNFQNVQIVNGRMSVNSGITHIFQVIPERTGQFTIPGISLIVGNETRVTQPLTLNVVGGRSGAAAAPPASGQIQSIPQSPPAQDDARGETRAALIELVFPDRDFYVGETIPLTVKTYFNPNVQVIELQPPTFEGASFTLPNLNFQPIQKTEILNGVEYNVLEWKTSIGTIKEGDFPVSAKIRGVLGVPSRPSATRGMSDDFFDSFFRRAVSHRELNLSSQESKIRVLPLPKENKPANFSGAIGSFRMASTASPTSLASGDPLTVKTVISGTGNFPQINAPEISSDKNYKTYSPTAKFISSGESDVSGEKVFEQIVIPTHSGIQMLPALEFSYFNPETKKYVTLSSDSLSLSVSDTPGSPGSIVTSGGVVGSATAPDGSRNLRQIDLVDNKALPGKLSSSFSDLAKNPLFWAAQAIPLTTLLIFLGLYRRRTKLENDPILAKKLSVSKAVQKHLSDMDESILKADASDFFFNARRALQQAIGERVHRNADSITLAEIPGQIVLPEDISRIVEEVFATADIVTYSGQTYDTGQLSEWKNKVVQAVTHIRKGS